MEPTLCTGCELHLYTEDSGPCPNCFPGLDIEAMIDRIVDECVAEWKAGTLPELTPEEKAFVRKLTDDYFTFQAAACTTRPGCQCGRH